MPSAKGLRCKLNINALMSWHFKQTLFGWVTFLRDEAIFQESTIVNEMPVLKSR